MRFTALGTGNFFTTGGENWHSNFFCELPNGERLLIDAGSDVRHAMADQGLGAMDFNSVFISHLHSDHAGGVEWYAFAHYFKSSADKPVLYLTDDLVAPLWNHALCASLVNVPCPGAVTLDTFFDVKLVGEERHFTWQGVEFETVPMQHVTTERGWFPTYGLNFMLGNKRLFFTCDTDFNPTGLMPYFEQADIILHDCEISEAKSGVHANYVDLKTLPAEQKAKMWLYHYQPGPRPDAVADGFAGWFEKGQTLSEEG
ncbi:MAG: MBL fold metallo-hydrolase [Alphaproteobacteria bacterium]